MVQPSHSIQKKPTCVKKDLYKKQTNNGNASNGWFSLLINIRRLWIFLSFIPLFTFTLAYLRMALVYKKLILLNVLVHENGKYTLLETVLYYDHFLRELFISGFLAFFIVGFFLYYGSAKPRKTSRKIGKYIIVCFFALALFLLIVFLGSIYKVGFAETSLSLFQYRTRDDLIEFGSHWRFHFLSRIGLFTSSAAIIISYRIIYNKTQWKNSKYALLILIVTSISYIIITLLFGITDQPFSDPRYLAHQGREFITHNLCTSPILITLLCFLEEKITEENSNHLNIKASRNLYLHFLFWSILSILIPSFLWIRLRDTDISTVAQQNWPVWDLLAFHFFEHLLDYIFVAILGVLIYLFYLYLVR